MPNIQIRGSQIQGETIEASNINLSGSFDFRAASSFIASDPSAAQDVATKAYVDAQLPDSFSAGEGIKINTSGDPDIISVLTASDGALSFIGGSSNELSVFLDGSTLGKSATGLKISDGGVDTSQLADGAVSNAKVASDAAIAQSKLSLDITNSEINASAAIAQSKLALDITNSEINASAAIAVSKLAASTISGVTLGSNLNALSAGNGISMTSFNGSAAVNDLTIDLDGSTLAVGAGGVKISDLGVDTGQLADSAVETAKINNLAVTSAKIADSAIATGKIADDAVTAAKIGDGEVGYAQINFESQSDTFSPDGSTLAFNLTAEVDDAMVAMVLAFKNGLLQRQVESSPANADEYTVSTAGGTTTITFGANLNANDELEARYLANKSA